MKYYIKTFGCQLNFSDSERIASFLESHKITPARDIGSADLIIFNTCGVRQTAEDRVYGQIHNLRKANKKAKIVVTGCLASRKDVQRKLKDKVDLFFPINNFAIFQNWIIENSLKIVNCKLKIENLDKKNVNSFLNIKPKYSNNNKICVPVMSGCNNFCSYCVVPYARGRERSRPVRDIIAEIEKANVNGCKEVLLLGQNVNSYKHRIDNLEFVNLDLNKNLKFKIKNSGDTVDFPLLLETLARSFSEIDFAFLTSHPKDFSKELIDVISKHQNISRNIHLPIQSGSDKILKAMNRHYTQKHYLKIIKKIKNQIPQAKISTDVIVGFPGETLKDFQQTVTVFEQVNYFEAFINKYSPRPGTAAFDLGNPVSWNEKKRREKILRSMISVK